MIGDRVNISKNINVKNRILNFIINCRRWRKCSLPMVFHLITNEAEVVLNEK